jgi:hypothetical protein
MWKECDEMQGFWQTYGKTASGVILMLVFATGLVLVLRKGWSEYATAGNLNLENDDNAEEKVTVSDKPILYVKSLRVLQGEELLLSSIAAAKDIDGEKLNEDIHFTDEAGCELENVFDTSIPGCYPLTVSVNSRQTGRRIKKRIVILVDGRCLESKQ